MKGDIDRAKILMWISNARQAIKAGYARTQSQHTKGQDDALAILQEKIVNRQFDRE